MKHNYTDEELANIQIINELDMKTFGISRFYLNNERAVEDGSASSTDWNQVIIKELIKPMKLAIEAYLDYYTGRRGKPSKTLYYLRCLAPEQAAFITIKNVLDSLSKEVKADHLSGLIGRRIEDQVRFANLEDEAPKYVEKVKKSLRQRGSVKYRHQAAVLSNVEGKVKRGNMQKGFLPNPRVRWVPWPDGDLLQLGSQLLDMFANNVLFNGFPLIEKDLVVNGRNNRVYISPTAEMIEWVEQYKTVMEAMKPMYSPCVVPPVPWTSQWSGGYHIDEISDTLPLVKCKRSQLERLTPEQMPAVYEAVNYLQEVPWAINEDILGFIKTMMDSEKSYCIPKLQPYEAPVCPVPERLAFLHGYEMKKFMSESEWKEFCDWKREVTNLIQKDKKRKSDFVKMNRLINSADSLASFKAIYFVYSLCFRGRMYVRSSMVSPQGDDMQKALLHFSEYEKIGPEGRFWMAVEGAGRYGYDKECTFWDMAEFTEKMSDQIRDIAADPLLYTGWTYADKPLHYLAFCFEWARFMDYLDEGGDEWSYETNLICWMDGSCSGIQHYSAMLRDPIGGAAVNLIPDDMPHDIYKDVAEVVKKEMVRIRGLTSKEFKMVRDVATAWLLLDINRTLTKKPVMTVPYGSTRSKCLAEVEAFLNGLQEREDTNAKTEGREPRDILPFARVGRSNAEQFCASVMWDSIGQVVVAARAGMKFIQSVATFMAKAGKHFEFITPTGFVFEQREMDSKSRRVKTQLFGETFMSLREETDKFNMYKMKSASAPHFVHSLDASHLVFVVNACKKARFTSLGVVHDSFGAHPNKINELRDIIRNEFVDMYLNNDVLQQLKDQNERIAWQEIPIEVPEKMGLDLEVVRKSEYFIK